MLSHQQLLKLLNYNPLTGEFTWLVSPNRSVKPGTIAGSIMGRGYWRVKVKSKDYMAHRLAWFYVHGRWPAEEMDHIDGNKLNNALSNLREATHQENAHNFATYKNNTSGYPGVSRVKKCSRWRAQIRSNNKTIHLGMFDTAYDAYLAYLRAKAKYHPFSPTHR